MGGGLLWDCVDSQDPNPNPNPGSNPNPGPTPGPTPTPTPDQDYATADAIRAQLRAEGVEPDELADEVQG